jgi:glutamate--cysteine ligase
MDLDPFEPIGIHADTLRFLDVFLLHCLHSNSPPDTPAEIEDLKRNQHLTAARGREPGLLLKRAGQDITLADWGQQLLAECAPIAAALDAAHGGQDYGRAVAQARARLAQPDTLPSARVLQAMREAHGDSFTGFIRARSQDTREHLLALPWSDAQQAHFERLSAESMAEQKRIEDNDSLPFEIYRERYVSADRLGQPQAA